MTNPIAHSVHSGLQNRGEIGEKLDNIPHSNYRIVKLEEHVVDYITGDLERLRILDEI